MKPFHHAEPPVALAAVRRFEVDPDGRQFLAEFRDEGLERQDSAPRYQLRFPPPFFCFFQGKSLFLMGNHHIGKRQTFWMGKHRNTPC